MEPVQRGLDPGRHVLGHRQRLPFRRLRRPTTTLLTGPRPRLLAHETEELHEHGEQVKLKMLHSEVDNIVGRERHTDANLVECRDDGEPVRDALLYSQGAAERDALGVELIGVVRVQQDREYLTVGAVHVEIREPGAHLLVLIVARQHRPDPCEHNVFDRDEVAARRSVGAEGHKVLLRKVNVHKGAAVILAQCAADAVVRIEVQRRLARQRPRKLLDRRGIWERQHKYVMQPPQEHELGLLRLTCRDADAPGIKQGRGVARQRGGYVFQDGDGSDEIQGPVCEQTADGLQGAVLWRRLRDQLPDLVEDVLDDVHHVLLEVLRQRAGDGVVLQDAEGRYKAPQCVAAELPLDDVDEMLIRIVIIIVLRR
eukprot:PhM_4_TR1079/c0_g1_i1/m.26874